MRKFRLDADPMEDFVFTSNPNLTKGKVYGEVEPHGGLEAFIHILDAAGKKRKEGAVFLDDDEGDCIGINIRPGECGYMKHGWTEVKDDENE